MARRNDELADTLLELPWWASIVTGVIAYLALTYVVPAIPFPGLIGKAFGPIARSAAPYVALGLFLAAPIVHLKQRHRRQLLDGQRGLDSIRALSWREFELLVGEAFRRQGFSIEERGGACPDGGIDLVLRRDGAVTVVQCKHWRERRVGVKPIRELYGVMTGVKATGALFVSSGSFTAEASAFSQNKPIGLIDGPALLELVQSVQGSPLAAQQAPDPVPSCHVCSRPMVRRVARKGSHKGQAFWGCTGYPHCKATQPA
jgi:restriction system protein